MLIDMDVSARVLKCKEEKNKPSEPKTISIWKSLVNVFTISICALSLVMCLRAIYRAQCLRKVRKFNLYFYIKTLILT